MDDIVIHVKTGDKKSAGTNANVTIILYDENKRQSLPVVLNNLLSDDFERGNLDSFTVSSQSISALQNPVKISYIELWKDAFGVDTDWFVDRIEIENKTTSSRFVFPIFRWIQPNVHYHIKHLDTSLPQFDEFPDQRRQGLQEKKATYELYQNIPNGPIQVGSFIFRFLKITHLQHNFYFSNSFFPRSL